MADSHIKSKIIARVVQNCDPLKARGNLRKIARARGFLLGEQTLPAMQIICGHEVVLAEDDRGYHCQFPIDFKVLFAENGDPYGLQEICEQFVQEVVEADPQLNGQDAEASLASKVTFEGVLEMTSEIIKPNGGVVLLYTVDYRRYRANPSRNY